MNFCKFCGVKNYEKIRDNFGKSLHHHSVTMKLFIICWVVYLIGTLGGNCDNNSSAFVATGEWQTVKKGKFLGITGIYYN